MKTRAHARTLIIRTNQNMEVYVFYRSSTTEKANNINVQILYISYVHDLVLFFLCCYKKVFLFKERTRPNNERTRTHAQAHEYDLLDLTRTFERANCFSTLIHSVLYTSIYIYIQSADNFKTT